MGNKNHSFNTNFLSSEVGNTKDLLIFKVTQWLRRKISLFDYDNNQWKKPHIIIQKVSRFPSLHISVKSLKIIRNYTCKQTKQGWTLIWVSHNCNCCLKIGTVVLTQWEKNWNLKFFDVYSKKYAFIEGTS